MADAAGLAAWQEKFEEWAKYAKPLFSQGKAKEACARYPWFGALSPGSTSRRARPVSGSSAPAATPSRGSRSLIESTIPEIVASFQADGVEAALLVPSWPICHQTVSLIARGFEQAEIPTVLVSVMPALPSPSRPPRQVIRRLHIGATLGRPHDVEGQTETLTRIIALLENAEAVGAVDKDEKAT